MFGGGRAGFGNCCAMIRLRAAFGVCQLSTLVRVNIVDYIADYTLRHLLAFASRKRFFSRVSRDENAADRA
jgi:hypothetical protein